MKLATCDESLPSNGIGPYQESKAEAVSFGKLDNSLLEPISSATSNTNVM
jgi:hypothetical protein